ncbi:hypothetical protein CDAR_99861 [Caerostris darwini]|uniref:Uncharacterized protein n=1 Tax=Caerostris darwini TaxID=1538125 RepID=A0AAV4REI8_9ARAC|nr:hypothetical protein CDAR_99861 [Caerostris darwini]
MNQLLQETKQTPSGNSPNPNRQNNMRFYFYPNCSEPVSCSPLRTCIWNENYELEEVSYQILEDVLGRRDPINDSSAKSFKHEFENLNPELRQLQVRGQNELLFATT